MTTCPILARLRAQEAAAARILGGEAYIPPVYTLGWHSDPPLHAGTYRWRLTPSWEEITREIDAAGVTYSHRFSNPVPAVKVGGFWFY